MGPGCLFRQNKFSEQSVDTFCGKTRNTTIQLIVKVKLISAISASQEKQCCHMVDKFSLDCGVCGFCAHFFIDILDCLLRQMGWLG